MCNSLAPPVVGPATGLRQIWSKSKIFFKKSKMPEIHCPKPYLVIFALITFSQVQYQRFFINLRRLTLRISSYKLAV